ncbi:MAG: fatty acid desaturase [Paracoccaceae bacterium]
MRHSSQAIEWPTLVLMAATYGLWALGTTALWSVSPVLAFVATVLAIGQHSSLMHEALHGHPFRNPHLDHALVFPAIGLLYPYGRFRDLHLAHHQDQNLTDPYDDPESNFQDPAVWARLSPAMRALLRFNNTMFGRVLVGTAIGAFVFYRDDLRQILAGNRRIRRDWGLHALGVALVFLWLVAFGEMPVWAYLLAAYAGNALVKIRTFLEHRAHDLHRARTVIVEDRGPLALLFLNNNLHVVHHCHPQVAWYDLPALYRGNRDHYLRRNDSYVYRSYAQIIGRYLFRAKDPVPHPIWPVRKRLTEDADCPLTQAAE